MLLEAQPTKEFVTSDQVAALALFLCSDDAAQITGSNLFDRRRLDRGVVVMPAKAGIQYAAADRVKLTSRNSWITRPRG